MKRTMMEMDSYWWPEMAQLRRARRITAYGKVEWTCTMGRFGSDISWMEGEHRRHKAAIPKPQGYVAEHPQSYRDQGRGELSCLQGPITPEEK